jgi:hypothetical protein
LSLKDIYLRAIAGTTGKIPTNIDPEVTEENSRTLHPHIWRIPGISTYLGQKRVDFINENDSWLPTDCNTNQCPDKFLTFTDL